MTRFGTVIAATPRQKPSSATTTPPGTALVRIIGNPNHTAATSERRLRCEAGTGLFSNSDSSSMPPTRSASVAVPDTDMGRSPPGRGGRNEPPRPPDEAGGAAAGGGGGWGLMGWFRGPRGPVVGGWWGP